MERKKIFISLAAFCDPLLFFTIENAVRNAAYPDRLVFGIIDQSDLSVEDEIRAYHPATSYIHIPPHQSRGACWARSLAMSLYGGEDYFFQTDSHMVFEQGWDEKLIETLENISARTKNDKIILSMRPFAFEFDENKGIRHIKFTDETLELILLSKEITLDAPILNFDSRSRGSHDDVRGVQVAGAFIFTRGIFVEEIPYDPYLYFHGEEQNISIRAFTHGWDIWHPNATVLYHLYKKVGEASTAPLHWDIRFNEKRQKPWHEIKTVGDKRLAKLFKGEDLGVYGLGSARSIDDYFKLVGLTIKDLNKV